MLSLLMPKPCFQFPLENLLYPGETGNNFYAKFSKINKVYNGQCENCKFTFFTLPIIHPVYKDFNMACKVNRVAMKLSHQPVACSSLCDLIKFRVSEHYIVIGLNAGVIS